MRRGNFRLTYEALLSTLFPGIDVSGINVECIHTDPSQRIVEIYVSTPDDYNGAITLYRVAESAAIPTISYDISEDISISPESLNDL